MLVAPGADMETKSVHGATPLHQAAGLGQVEAVRVLVELGANLGARTEAGETSVQLSLSCGHHAAALVLKGLQSPIRSKKKAETKVPSARDAAASTQCGGAFDSAAL